MKRNNIFALSIFSLFLFISLISLTGCEDNATPTTTFTVTFAGEGVTISPQTVPDGSRAQQPTNPTRDGFTFTGWQDDNGSLFSFNTAITANITLTAQWVGAATPTFTVTFAGQGINVQSQNVQDGAMATLPPTPTRDGFTFVNWYKDAMFNELYDFSTAVKSNITVYASWLSLSNNNYTVTFDANEGKLTSPLTVKVKSGEKLTKPTDPTQDGFTFVNWLKPDDGGAFDFTTDAITDNITLIAQWGFTVTFAGEEVNTPPQAVPDGSMAKEPPNPTRDRFDFVEWQTDNGSPFSFNTAITADITLTAQWADAVGSLTDVTIVLNDDNTAYTVNYTYTNPQGDDTGGTLEVTWFLSDNADGTSPTQVSTEATYMPTGVNRYNKYLVASVRVMTAAGRFTETVRKIIYPGFSTEATRGSTSTRFSARYDHTSVRFKEKIWVIGGFDGSRKNDVWSSEDGANWTQVTAAAPFSARSEHTSVAFGGKIWVIGGESFEEGSSRGVSKNDVWSSEDGATWTQVTAAAAFSARTGHTSVAFNGRMWVIGGGLRNDVWSSKDGLTWTQVTAAAPFSGREDHTSVVLNNKIWVIGGNDGSNKNDVWSSSDGVTWTQVTAAAPFSARSVHTSVAFDGKIWVIGGGYVDEESFELLNGNDVWSSEDGRNWIEYQEVPKSSRFSGRFGHTSVAFDGKIWVIGGSSSGDAVWY